ncbi:MAG: histidinol dehydrogenase, partial [Rhodospirillaceae bacterium]
MARKLKSSAPGFAKTFSALVAKSREDQQSVDGVVANILADVKARGDAAVLDYTKKFDNVELA